jgi:uncharacterized membrane protein YgcG
MPLQPLQQQQPQFPLPYQQTQPVQMGAVMPHQQPPPQHMHPQQLHSVQSPPPQQGPTGAAAQHPQLPQHLHTQQQHLMGAAQWPQQGGGHPSPAPYQQQHGASGPFGATPLSQGNHSFIDFDADSGQSVVRSMYRTRCTTGDAVDGQGNHVALLGIPGETDASRLAAVDAAFTGKSTSQLASTANLARFTPTLYGNPAGLTTDTITRSLMEGPQHGDFEAYLRRKLTVDAAEAFAKLRFKCNRGGSPEPGITVGNMLFMAQTQSASGVAIPLARSTACKHASEVRLAWKFTVATLTTVYPAVAAALAAFWPSLERASPHFFADTSAVDGLCHLLGLHLEALSYNARQAQMIAQTIAQPAAVANEESLRSESYPQHLKLGILDTTSPFHAAALSTVSARRNEKLAAVNCELRSKQARLDARVTSLEADVAALKSGGRGGGGGRGGAGGGGGSGGGGAGNATTDAAFSAAQKAYPQGHCFMHNQRGGEQKCKTPCKHGRKHFAPAGQLFDEWCEKFPQYT